MNRIRFLLLFLLLLALVIFFALDLDRYLTLEFFRTRQQEILDFYHHHPVDAGLYFFIIYIVVTGVSLPGAGIMTLIGGAIFGLLWGSIIVSFASAIGATIAMLVSRFLFRDLIQQRFSDKLRVFNEGMERDGALYLFTLRLVPIFPFFIINLVMGLTPIRSVTFYVVSQIGMLPFTVLFVNAGKQIASIHSVQDILSTELLVSLVLVGVFPLLAKKSTELIRGHRERRRLEAGEDGRLP